MVGSAEPVEVLSNKRILSWQLVEPFYPLGIKPVSLQPDLGLIFKALFKKYFLFRNWNQVSKSHGLVLTTDTIHLNNTSGKIMAEEVKNCIVKKLEFV